MDDVSFFASDPKAERVGQGGSHRVTLGAPAKMLGLYINVGEGKTEAVSARSVFIWLYWSHAASWNTHLGHLHVATGAPQLELVRRARAPFESCQNVTG